MAGSRRSCLATFALELILVTGWTTVINPPYAEAITQDFLSFNFFWHDNLNTPMNSSTFTIVPPLVPPPFPGVVNNFGSVRVFDDSLTVTEDPTSVEIGRGRGTYIFALSSSLGIEFLWTAEFNAASGYGMGSTLTFHGFDRFSDPVREIAIVGGTGKFRLARGWLDFSTYSTNGRGTAVLNMTANVFYGFG